MKRLALSLRPRLFLLLSLTWGLPLTLAGSLVALVCLLTGHRARRWGPCVYFEFPGSWGGCEFGLFFLTDGTRDDRLRSHELGHGLQNCLFGPLMPFLVTLPSACRYWNRRGKLRRGVRLRVPYDGIWFESQATRLGRAYIEKYYPEAH